MTYQRAVRVLGASLILSLLAALPLPAQRELAGAARIQQALDRLNVLGTVLMIAAHPDDENTALLAYLARGRKFRTAYLSLTRGEGGQNLIGPELGDLLGVIRTQELLAARRIDGAEQYFTRAVDFGYSKTADETLGKWGREEILADVVWVIRKLRPDVIVLRFSGTNTDGHGHHQSSAMLGQEAFRAAADPKRFPGQLRYVQPWQAKRIVWNVFSFRRGSFTNQGDMAERISLNVGAFDPLLGFNYTEIAGMSRSQHRSQGFGAPEAKGSQEHHLTLVAGEPASGDLMDGVDATWNRVPGGAAVGEILRRAAQTFVPQQPEQTAPLLLEARRRLVAIDDPWAAIKLRELDDAIALTCGLWLDAAAAKHSVVPGETVAVRVTALNRSPVEVRLNSVRIGEQAPLMLSEKRPLADNQPVVLDNQKWAVPEDQEYTRPYWLQRPREGARYTIPDQTMIGTADTPPAAVARFGVEIAGQTIEYERPIVHRWVDRVRGELERPIAIVPPVSVRLLAGSVVFASAEPKPLEIRLTANVDGASGSVSLGTGGGFAGADGWQPQQEEVPFTLEKAGEQRTVTIAIAPPDAPGEIEISAVARTRGLAVTSSTRVIDYEHFPVQTLALPARAKLVRVRAETLARRVGYIMGAGDDVPAALRQLGCEVTLLDEEALARGDLGGFDAIVAGIRASNVRPDLLANQGRLLEYVKAGGTLIVQYNVQARAQAGEPDPFANMGPYPIEVGRGRVSVEEAPVRFIRPEHPLLTQPNRITERDFEGWVQERGLYFASQWDERYQAVFEMADPGEAPLAGSTLYARYGDGVFVFTGLSLFRQLPAGVPGAYRLFANMLSAGKAQ